MVKKKNKIKEKKIITKNNDKKNNLAKVISDVKIKKDSEESLEKKVKPEKKVDNDEDETIEKLAKGSESEEDSEKEITIVDTDFIDYMNLFSMQGGYSGNDNGYVTPQIDTYRGFVYASNIINNSDMISLNKNIYREKGSDSDLMDIEDVKRVSRTMIINGMTGQHMYNDVSVEDHEKLNGWIMDPSNKTKYLMTSTLLGLGMDPLNGSVKREYQAKGPGPS